MIDIPSLIAVHAGIDHGLCIHREQKRMVVVRVLVLIPRIRLRVAHAFAEVLNDRRALADAARSEDAIAMDAGVSHFEQGSAAALRNFFHTEMGALMAA